MSRPKPGEDGRHVTFCRICEAFCGMTVTVENGRIVEAGPDRENPLSRGHLCVKGPAMVDVTYDEDRVLHPLRRRGRPGELERVSWDEALDDISKRLAAILETFGPAAVAAFVGNPSAFSIGNLTVVHPFLAALGASKVFSSASQDSTSRHTASFLLYGSAVRFAIPDLERCDLLLIFGANPLVTHGSILTAPRIRKDLEQIAARGRVVVVDPRRTETASRFEHLPVTPGGDAWLLAAMLRTIFDEGLADLSALDSQATGWESLRDAISRIPVETAAERSGVPLGTIQRLARDFAGTPRAAAYGRVGICRGRFSTLANFFLDALNVVAGKFGRPGGSVFGFSPAEPTRVEKRPQGYGEARTRIGDLPSVAGFLPTAVLADEILEDGEDRLRALFVTAGNPVSSAPGGARLERALDEIDLFVSLDLYVTETNRFADYVLPAVTFFERADVPLLGLAHMPRPFLQYTDAVIEPRGEARNEIDVLREIAVRVVGPDRVARTPLATGALDAFDQMLRSGPLGGELDLERLKAKPHGILLDRPLRYEDWRDAIFHPDDRIHLWHEMIGAELERMLGDRPEASDEILLFGRRDLRSINSWMHNVDRLTRTQSPTLLLHPADAAARSIDDGQTVRLTSRAGTIEVTARVSTDVVRGSASYPHGWGHDGGWKRAVRRDGANVNRIASTDPDDVERVSGTSLLDGIRVRVTPVA